MYKTLIPKTAAAVTGRRRLIFFSYTIYKSEIQILSLIGGFLCLS